MDVLNLGFVGLMVIGVVNVATMLRPTLTSTDKFIIGLIAAFAFGFVPADLANEIANRVKDALQIAFASSGGYKVAQKAGGS